MAAQTETPAGDVLDKPASAEREREPSQPSVLTPAPVRDRFGNYRLCFEIASGGMASVYLARSEGPAGFERLVAIKRIHPHLASQTQFTEMFLDEARIAALITHPNVCRIYDFGAVEGVYYIAMEYLRGETFGRVFSRLVKSGRVRSDSRTPAFASRLGVEVAEGLHAAHELSSPDGQPLRVVHRDVSPQNLFASYDGSVRIVDFGIARAENRIHETGAGVRKGKIAYMAPEQVRGTGVDRRVDVWSLGVVLWELLAGRRLFLRETDVETMLAVVEASVPLPSVFNPRVPAGLDAVVCKALARDPGQRFASAREFGRALSPFTIVEGHPIGMPEIGEWLSSLFPDGQRRLDSLLERARSATPVSTPSVRAPAETPSVPASRETSGVVAVDVAAPEPPPNADVTSKAEDDGTDDATTTVAEELSSSPATPLPTPTLDVEAAAPVRRKRAPWRVLPVLVVAGALGAAVAWWRLPSAPPRAVVLRAPEASSVVPEPAALAPAAAPASPVALLERPTAVSAVPAENPAEAPVPTVLSRRRPPRAQPTVVRNREPPPDLHPRPTVEPSPPPTAREPATRSTGLVNVVVAGGWAEIQVGGVSYGRSPRQFALPLGVQRMTLLPFGQQPAIEREVTVQAGSVSRLRIQL